MKFGTKVIHSGIYPDPATGAIMTPIYQTSTYAQEKPGVHKGFEYARTHNPTRKVLQENLAALENGEAGIAFSSGLAAMDAIMKILKPGDEVLSTNDLYGGSYRLMTKIYGKFGIESRFIDMESAESLRSEISTKTKMLWIETPTNPLLNIIDIEKVCAIAKEKNSGQVAQYIPELAKVDPDKFGAHLLTTKGESYGAGDWQTKFSIQSISKVLSLSLAYKMIGDKIWSRVDVEPSGNPFNSLVQLETDEGIPRNPLINAGAMVICDILFSNLKNPSVDFLNFIREITANKAINYSTSVAASEKSVGYRNIALCNFIKSFGNIENHPDEVLDFYFQMCSIEMSCEDLTKAFMFLAHGEFKTAQNNKILTISKAKRINAIMQTCGFYDESGEFSFKVGLPGKSGVGGGILAVHPNNYCLAVWSPKLNEKGNSYRGMKFLELFTTLTESSIF